MPVIRQPFPQYDHGDDVHDHHDAGEDEIMNILSMHQGHLDEPW